MEEVTTAIAAPAADPAAMDHTALDMEIVEGPVQDVHEEEGDEEHLSDSNSSSSSSLTSSSSDDSDSEGDQDGIDDSRQGSEADRSMDTEKDREMLPKKRGRPAKKKEGDRPTKPQGRPAKERHNGATSTIMEDGSVVVEKEKRRRKKKGKKNQLPAGSEGSTGLLPASALSVRSIPCFFSSCNYSYKRPGSSIVEISDRPLVLPKKFDGYTIRSCKKHHDKWKGKEKKGPCDVCRGLNASGDVHDSQNYVNAKGTVFKLCAFCFGRQESMLELLPQAHPVIPSSSVSDSEEEGEIEVDASTSDKNEEFQHCKYIVYKRKEEDVNWSLVKKVTYISQLVWDNSVRHLMQKVESSTVGFSKQVSPFPLCIKKVDEELSLCAGDIIPADTCLGAFTGKVVTSDEVENPRFCCPFLEGTKIDATNAGNELRFIKDSMAAKKKANVRLEIVDGHALLISLKKLKKDERLYGDLQFTQEAESKYFETLESIYSFNKETLSEEDERMSAFHWFISEGYILLGQRAKVTVPIEHRIPAKKSIASGYNVKKIGKLAKSAVDWGYVAQLEEMDMERAREDCWVTFKASSDWDVDAFDRALTAWRKSRSMSAPTEMMITKTSSIALDGSSSPSSKVAVVSPRPLSPAFKREMVPPAFKIRKSASFSPLSTTRSPVYVHDLEEIPYSHLSIKQDCSFSVGSKGYANVFRGDWKRYPVAVRFPSVHAPRSEEERKRFVKACGSSALVHPNIVTSYACCKDNLCLVMELMNLGNLEEWLTSTHPEVQAMYIPRIAMDIARAVEYIHSKGVVHGCLKSTNVLMKGERLDQGLIANLEVKVGDLGVGVEHLLLDKNKQRNVIFIAPEILAGGPVTQTSDMYGFGMVLAHMFSEGTKEPRALEEVVSTSRYLQLWDPRWKQLLLDCTHKNPVKRPTFSEIMEVLIPLSESSKLT